MVFVLRRKTIRRLLFLVFSVCFAYCGAALRQPVQPVVSVVLRPARTIVLDAGHGGEDGGAISSDGIKESQLNLEIAQKLRNTLQFCGQKILMIREEDCSLDHGEATIRRRKSSDLKTRAELVNAAKRPVLISIHQNSLPSSPITHGAQVFWNSHESAADLAQLIQDALNMVANPNHHKQTRKISTSVYLMNHSKAPSVLVECGFLSNRQETEQLQTNLYQQKLALCIAAGLLRWSAGEELA